jgi:hypothetical protein
MIAIFIVGCFITTMVGAAGWLVVAGLRTDMHEREDRTIGESSKRAEGIS